jgi:hypothetical protein
VFPLYRIQFQSRCSSALQLLDPESELSESWNSEVSIAAFCQLELFEEKRYVFRDYNGIR